MIYVNVTRSYCQYCGEFAPQRVVRQQGETPMLWCDVCHRVTIADHKLSLQIDPIPFLPTLSVQVAELDADHEVILGLLNDLHAAARAGDGDRLAADGHRLFQDLNQHFEREEALLRAWDYPDLETHRQQHVELGQEVRRLLDDLNAAPAPCAANIVLAMKFCLIEHLGEDMKYKNHLAGQA